MMDGTAQQEEEEVRPKRGKSIRLPEDTDLEAQRSPSPPPTPCRHILTMVDQHYSPPQEHAKQSVSPNQTPTKPLLPVPRTTLHPRKSCPNNNKSCSTKTTRWTDSANLLDDREN
jgi:hypothetical protein